MALEVLVFAVQLKVFIQFSHYVQDNDLCKAS